MKLILIWNSNNIFLLSADQSSNFCGKSNYFDNHENMRSKTNRTDWTDRTDRTDWTDRSRGNYRFEK